MDIASLISSIIGLVVILAFALFFLFYSSKRTLEQTTQQTHKDEEIISFESLKTTLQNKESTTHDLKNALHLIIEYYGIIEESNLQKYQDLIFIICSHSNTDKNIILYFDKELRKRNKKYENRLNSTLTNALNARRNQ